MNTSTFVTPHSDGIECYYAVSLLRENMAEQVMVSQNSIRIRNIETKGCNLNPVMLKACSSELYSDFKTEALEGIYRISNMIKEISTLPSTDEPQKGTCILISNGIGKIAGQPKGDTSKWIVETIELQGVLEIRRNVRLINSQDLSSVRALIDPRKYDEIDSFWKQTYTTIERVIVSAGL